MGGDKQLENLIHLININEYETSVMVGDRSRWKWEKEPVCSNFTSFSAPITKIFPAFQPK